MYDCDINAMRKYTFQSQTRDPKLKAFAIVEDTTERLPFHFSLSCTGEGNGNPFQCSCLENPGDGGAWWAAIYGVAQSRTRLKRLSSSSSNCGPQHAPCLTENLVTNCYCGPLSPQGNPATCCAPEVFRRPYGQAEAMAQGPLVLWEHENMNFGVIPSWEFKLGVSTLD